MDRSADLTLVEAVEAGDAEWAARALADGASPGATVRRGPALGGTGGWRRRSPPGRATSSSRLRYAHEKNAE